MQITTLDQMEKLLEKATKGLKTKKKYKTQKLHFQGLNNVDAKSFQKNKTSGDSK